MVPFTCLPVEEHLAKECTAKKHDGQLASMTTFSEGIGANACFSGYVLCPDL